MKKEIQDKINEIEAARQRYRTLIRENGKSLIKVATEGVFETFPGLRSIQWAQYTPYFNDGDACTFSVHECRVQFTEEYWSSLSETEKECFYEYGDGWEFDDYQLKQLAATGKGEELRKLSQAIRELDSIKNNLEEMLEETFGNHVKVIVSRDGIKTKEHRHD